MLAAGGGYTRDNTSSEGDLSMMILYGFGTFRPFSRAQVWAAEHLVSIHGASGDLRCAIAALALRSLAALEALIERQLVLLARTIMVRAWQGARFTADMTHADTMVAAGGG
jgi:hypothetical protein